ncbi:MAG TPA: dihydrodipicolinate synthase family protein [Actinobacteria bacterium]|nr:dihydrodipicolinate synthase family protein [Actinomycetota bacterium]
MRRPPRVLPALVTPFREDGALDVVAFRHNLRRLAADGVAGFVVGGSTGEGPYLEPDERRILLEAARAELGDEPFLLCGVSAESTRAAIAQIGEATVARADAVLVVTPTSLVRGRADLVAGHFVDVADASPLPVFLYSVPPVTGYELPVDVVDELATHPNIVGLKDSGGDPRRLPPLAPVIEAGFLVYCGASAAIAESVGLGAYGAITASANYAFSLVDRLVATGEGQEELAHLTRVVEAFGVAGTKAAAGLVGLHPGSPRRPLLPLDAVSTEEIAAALETVGLR